MFKNFVSSLKSSIEKSKEYLSSGINQIFAKEKINDSTIQELEELLLSADIGPAVTDKITRELRKIKVSDGESLLQIKRVTSKEIIKILEPVEKKFPVTKGKPQVIVFCGINGNGKTTTIGKLAYKLQQEGKKVMIAACDLFRAAAIEQLHVWAERSSSLFFSDETSKSASSTAYKALENAIAEGVDTLIIDTAGRLHTHNELMEELKKVCRVLSKLITDAPHEVILALDASTGQNALSQISLFKEKVNLTGLVITKLDGTSKGGIIVALADKNPELGIYFIGTGEKVTDLQEFSAVDFATHLLEIDVKE